MVFPFRFTRKLASQSRRRMLRVEQLECRYLLDGNGISLADDLFAMHQNGPQVALDVLANDRFDDTYEGQH